MTDDDDDQFLTVLIETPWLNGTVNVTPARVVFDPSFSLDEYVACVQAVCPNATAVMFI